MDRRRALQLFGVGTLALAAGCFNPIDPNDIEVNPQRSERETVTVGDGGDYASLTDAIAERSTEVGAFEEYSILSEIEIQSGHVVEDQIVVEQLDLSHIVITGEDGEVPVRPVAFAEQLNDRDSKPFLCGQYGAQLPVIDTRFVLHDDAREDITGMVLNRGSTGVVRSDGGFIGFHTGVLANNGSHLTARSGVFRDHDGAGVHARHMSDATLAHAELTNCGIGAQAWRCSRLDIRFADCSGSTTGAIIRNGSIAEGHDFIAENCADHAVEVRQAGAINLRGGSLDGAGNHAVLVSRGSSAHLDEVEATGAGQPVRVKRGSTATVDFARLSQGSAVVTDNVPGHVISWLIDVCDTVSFAGGHYAFPNGMTLTGTHIVARGDAVLELGATDGRHLACTDGSTVRGFTLHPAENGESDRSLVDMRGSQCVLENCLFVAPEPAGPRAWIVIADATDTRIDGCLFDPEGRATADIHNQGERTKIIGCTVADIVDDGTALATAANTHPA